ncbi:MAG TPA: polysaccharide deacetylase family protein [Patescibacteria group bacterium]|nr:polysaccharide deacetylase family protein [Patescibacteria group bacterium]
MKKHAKSKDKPKILQEHDNILSVFKQYVGYFILLILLFIGIGGFTLYKIHSSQKKLLPETEKNEMKKIPPDVKKALAKQSQIASISATLHVPILMYHYVEYVKDKNDKERQLLNVNPNVFEEQIQTLLSAGYIFITAKDLGDILDGVKQPPAKPIILTFDDGHWDLDANVLPILKKYNIHATTYIVPGFIGTNSDSLTPQEMQDVVNSGLIDIGAHTVHHISLKGKPLALVQYEVDQSKAMLENTYHIHVYSFAYPYGTFDQQTITVVKQAGFTTATSTIAGNEQSNQNRYFLFRVRPGYLIGQALLNYLNLVWNSYKQ